MHSYAIENQAPAAPWYAVQTRTKAEKLVATNLEERGYEVFLPLRRTPGKPNPDEPLFPSYLFCRATGKSMGLIVNVPGAVRLLGVAGKPEAVTDEEINGVRKLVDADCPVRSEAWNEPGKCVTLQGGPLRGAVGRIVERGDGPPRFLVSVGVLGRSVAIDVEAAWLGR